MKAVARLGSLLTFLATAAGAAACGGGLTSSADEASGGAGSGDNATGSLGLQLVIPSGQTIPTLAWAITGPNGAATVVQSGSALSQSSGASLLIGSIPAGQGYEISMSGTATDGSVTCTGSAFFSIAARATTQVSLSLACGVATSGSHVVLVNGSSFDCAAWDNVSASPTETNVGGSVVLSATAAAPSPSAITYRWSAPSGTFSSPNSAVTSFTCATAGVVSATLVVGDGPVPAGSSCDMALTTTTVSITCDANYSVVRHGVVNATQTLASTATPVFVENHAINLWANPVRDTVLSTVALPTAVSGAQQPFAYQGVASVAAINDGALSRSTDGHFLALAGYGATPGTTGVVTTSSVPRVIARIDAQGHVDTSTYLPLPPGDGGAGGAYQSAFVRSAATNDGSAFWVGGNDNTTGGVWYVPFGSAGSGVQLNPTDARVVNIYGGQLYGDTDPVGSMPELFAIGTGEPITAPANDVALPGVPLTVSSNGAQVSGWAFAFANASTLYIASDQAIAGANPPDGIQKWTLSGGTWSLQTTFGLAAGQPSADGGAIASTVGFRGIALLASGSASTIFVASTVEPGSGSTVPPNHLAVFVDNGGPYSAQTSSGVVYGQAPASALYRGIALSPQ